MSHKTQTVIPWPFWDKPFRRTARGYLSRRETTRRAFVGFVGCLCLAFSLAFTGIGIVAVPFLFLGWAVFCVFKLLPARRVITEARRHCESWRNDWLRFEHDSLAFQHTVRSNQVGAFDAYDKAPTVPPVAWNLIYNVSKPLADFSIPPTIPQEQRIAMARRNLSRFLCELIRLGGRGVVGKGANELAAYGIFVLTGSTQFWVRVAYVATGGVLFPQLTMGVQPFSGPFMDREGHHYPGDLAKLRRYDFKLFLVLLTLAVPGLGLFTALCLVWTIPTYFRTNLVVNLQSRLWSHCGDAADPVILQAEKSGIKNADQWTTLRHEVESDIEAMKQETVSAVHRALLSKD